MKMFRTSRLQKIVKVPQVNVIDDPGRDAEGSEARGDADQFQSLLHKHDGQSADNDPRFTMNSRERQPRR